MQLSHDFTVPVPVDTAWAALLDVEGIAPCLPGASVDSFDGETVTGRVRVKLGAIQITYRGTARFVQRDAAAHRTVIDASGRETKGSGTATATVTTTLSEDPAGTKVQVRTDLSITGKPAQFGRGVLVDVSGRLVETFATCLGEKLRGGRDAATAAPPAGPPETASPPLTTGAPGQVPAAPADPGQVPAAPADPGQVPAAPAEAAPIDLLATAGWPILRRSAPALALLTACALALIGWRRRRRR
jgi:carbon monoxide dehydrogenase subunit G